MTRLDRAIVNAYHRRVVHVPVRPQLPAAPVPTRAPARRSRTPRTAWCWPGVCDSLLALAASGFDGLARQLRELSDERPFSIAFTSPERGEGLTTVVLTLARALTQHSQERILMVDGDFEQPGLARTLGLVPEAGWQELALENTASEGVLLWSDDQQIALLPLAAPVPATDLRAWESQWIDSLHEVRHEFDLVLMDAGPLGQVALPEGWIRTATDTTIIVSSSRKRNGPTALAEELRRCRAAGIDPLGVIETFK